MNHETIEDVAKRRYRKAVMHFSPGLRGTSYPGKTTPMILNPNGVASNRARGTHNPYKG